MKKTVILLTAALYAAFLLAACKAEKTAANAGSADITCRLITDASGVDDKSFNAAAWRGMLQYYGDTWDNPAGRGTLYDVVTCQTPDQYIPIIQQATDEKYDLIITTGFAFSDALTSVAEKNLDQNYLIVDVDWVSVSNVLNAVFSEHEGSYLVGVAAALKAIEDGIANPRFGFIGGMPSSTITKFEVGYVQGGSVGSSQCGIH